MISENLFLPHLNMPRVEGWDEDEIKKLPARDISVTPEYTGIIISKGHKDSLDLNIFNNGRQDEGIAISFPSVPKGWEVWTQTYNFKITAVATLNAMITGPLPLRPNQ